MAYGFPATPSPRHWFGRRAGRSAADYVRRLVIARSCRNAPKQLLDRRRCADPRLNTAEMLQTLQKTMQDNVGALRSGPKLAGALDTINRLTSELGDTA